MPMYEYLVGVTPPGGRTKHCHRGTLYWPTANEELAAERAIEIISDRYGFNLKQEYTCIVNQMDSEEA
jgi:hypothetical protein